MKQQNIRENPYATNKGGLIRAPRPADKQPAATVRRSTGDLRDKR